MALYTPVPDTSGHFRPLPPAAHTDAWRANMKSLTTCTPPPPPPTHACMQAPWRHPLPALCQRPAHPGGSHTTTAKPVRACRSFFWGGGQSKPTLGLGVETAA